MDLAVKNNERFVVDRRGEPAVVIMSVQDFVRIAAPSPDWLKRHGMERSVVGWIRLPLRILMLRLLLTGGRRSRRAAAR